MQAHREYVRTEQRRYASVEGYYEDHPALDSDAPEMKGGEVCIGNTGLTHDEFMQAIADMEAAGGWDKCTAHPSERAA
jgi:hypothetical protein